LVFIKNIDFLKDDAFHRVGIFYMEKRVKSELKNGKGRIFCGEAGIQESEVRIQNAFKQTFRNFRHVRMI